MQEIAVNETALVQEARSGNLESFSALVRLYEERAIHTAYAIIGNYEDARDIAQESFVKAYVHLESFKAESRFYTWFYRILVNLSKDFLRKKKLRQALSFFSAGRGDGEVPDPVLNVPSRDKGAPEELMNRELGARIFEALEKLPFRQRSAFSLRYLEGLSLEAVALALSISVGAAKAHVWQAGDKMKKLLKEENP